MNGNGQHMLKKACVPHESHMVGFVIAVNSNCQEKVNKAQEIYDNGSTYFQKKEGNGFLSIFFSLSVFLE
jgi:hypothetical protein